MNITVVTGHLTRPPERRVLPSGDELVGFDVAADRDGRAESVPVVWPAAPTTADDLPLGEAVVVVGRVRRRFFRAGGTTQSRTEVVADLVVPARRTAAARKAVEQAVAELVSGAAAPAAPRRARPAGAAAQAADAS